MDFIDLIRIRIGFDWIDGIKKVRVRRKVGR